MKKLRKLWVLVLFLAVLFSSACSYKAIKHGSEITDEQVAIIEDGKTSKEEVIIEFGDPSKIMNDEKIFFYTWTRGSKSSVLGFGGGTAYTKSLVVVFDENGVVKSHKITRGTTKEGARIGD